MQTIQNIIFDIGNVIVKWSPQEIIKRSFGNSDQQQAHYENLFKHPIWHQLNLGQISEVEAIVAYSQRLPYSTEQLKQHFANIRASLNLVAGTQAIIQTLHQNQYPLFILSDNVVEFVRYLKQQYDFWQYFNDSVFSCDIGFVKPAAEIYQHTLDKFSINPAETLFIDDLAGNVSGAQAAGMHAIQFTNAEQCRTDLIAHEIRL